MNDLMIHVERAVRPVRASMERKLAMREQSLAQLQSNYEEQLQELGDHNQAVQEALHRFGSVKEVSRRMQKSVPWHDVVVRCHMPFPPLRPSVCNLTLSTWIWQMLLIGAMHATILWSVSIAELAVISLLSLALFASFYGMAGAIHGILNHSRSYRRAFLYGAACAGFLAAAGIVIRPPGIHPLFIAAYAVLLTITLAVISIGFARKMAKFEAAFDRARRWDQLELPS